MSRREVTEWLLDLERRDGSVRIYMDVRRRHGIPNHDLAPENLVGLVQVLVEAKERIQAQLDDINERIVPRHIDPPMTLVDKIDLFRRLQMRPGSKAAVGEPVRFISADEWPATERALVEVSKVIYFRDFLRSFWRRLTGR